MTDPDRATTLLALDGPPGAGKTSLLAHIVPALADACMFFTEPNTRLTDGVNGPIHPSPAGLSLWYLRHEQAKARQLSALSEDPATRLVALDRNHLGALAYCHATRADDALPYPQALDFYHRHIAALLPADLQTVILLVSPEQSLLRRGGIAERPRWQQWFDSGLLARLRDFYLEIAPSLCPRPPVLIDTDRLSPDEVLAHVAAVVPALQLSYARRPSGTPSVTPMFAQTYTNLGGLETFGHPLTDAFDHRGGTVQMCQLGTLHRTASGTTGAWDLLTQHSTAALP